MTVKLPTTKNVDIYTAKQYPDLWTGGNPKGAIIHNDAGRMSATDYITWLKYARTPNTSKAELGFANYYIDRNNIVRVATTTIGGYAAANPYYNKNFLHYEVCQQLGANDADWLANERAVFMQVAEDFHYYGLKASKDTIVLHHDVSRTGTSCPQPSMKTHGGNYPAVRQYFINQVAYYMSLGKTVKEMVNALNKAQKPTVTPSKTTTNTNTGIVKKYAEKGVFYPNETIIVRDAPTTKANIVARYRKGESLTYHTVHIGNGYVWLEYLRNNGKSGFIPIREYKNGKYGKVWGTIK
ncbi:SH3 domain-containing protein [Aerococcus urinaeequi]|uniref:SH3 domain-containing protein n=1 Tax=Aerococcus urinaeequi TaxID=51665 RepID=UPI0036723AAC